MKTRPWQQVIAETGQPNGKARYGPYPNVTEAQIRIWELGAVTPEDPRTQPNELPRQKDHVRSFWRKLDSIVGASVGEETEYIYVEYALDGSVHGRPMTKKQLIDKGMPE